MTITLNRICKYLETSACAENDIQISEVFVDSRKVTPGSAFVALHGENTDGHSYIASAIEKGAVAILAEESYRQKLEATIPAALKTKTHIIYTEDTLMAMGIIAKGLLNDLPEDKPIKVAVTGSVGKTTTKEMIACCLSAGGKTHKTQGNRNSEIGFPMTIYEMPEDSDYAVCEMGMRGLGQVKYLTEIYRPHIAVVTNIGIAHIELLGSRENILKAKLEITIGMKNSPESVLLLNGDDNMLSDKKLVTQILEEYNAENITIKYFGNAGYCDYRIVDTKTDGKEQSFTLKYADGNIIKEKNVSLAVPGVHNLMNAAVSLACAHIGGADVDKACGLLADFGKDDAIRQRIITTPAGYLIDDAYNAGPESMKASLSVLAGLDADVRIAALADMLELGDFSQKAHEEVGQAASFCADILIAHGRLAEHYTKTFHGRTFMSDELADTVNIIKDLIDHYSEQNKRVAILVKGSNSMKMSVVAKEAQEYMNNK